MYRIHLTQYSDQWRPSWFTVMKLCSIKGEAFLTTLDTMRFWRSLLRGVRCY